MQLPAEAPPVESSNTGTIPRRDHAFAPLADGSASVELMAEKLNSTPMLNVLRRAWGRVRWKIAAIIVFTGTSTILIACLAVAALNVVVRRESANVVEKQIQVLVQASRSVAPAILDNAGSCTVSAANAGGLK